MRIGFEAKYLLQEGTGFFTYSYNLLRTLTELSLPHEFRIFIRGNTEKKERIAGLFPLNTRILNIDCPDFLYKHLMLPGFVSKERIGLFHYLYNSAALYTPAPFVVTIHDLFYRHMKRNLSLKNYLSLSLQMKRTAEKAKKIIAISHYTKSELVDYLRIKPDKISVIYHGRDERFYWEHDQEKLFSVKAKYNLPEKFFMYVGGFLKHKNLSTLIKAFSYFRKKSMLEHKLILVGRNTRNLRETIEEIRNYNLEDKILWLGYVAVEDLAAIYNLAEALIIPSFFEGFCFPLLEAMACGTPIIASRSSSLPEIAGDAAVYFEPYNYAELTQEMTEIAANRATRKRISEEGLKRAQLFDWKKCAAEVSAVYNEI